MKYLLFLFPLLLTAGSGTSPVLNYANDPSGSCPAGKLAVSKSSGHFFHCDTKTGNWAQDTGAASNASTTVNGVTCALGSTCTVADSTKVPTSTTVNGHALSGNVTVTSADVNNSVASVNFAASPYSVPVGVSYISCDATAGVVVINLPAATGSGREISFKKIDSSANACTPTHAGSDTIDGVASYNLSFQYAASKIVDRATGLWDRSHVNQMLGNVTGVSTANVITGIGGASVTDDGSILTIASRNIAAPALSLTTPLPPASGGVGTMTGAPAWLRYLGRGADGPQSDCNSTLSSISGAEYDYTSFGVAAGHTCTFSGHNTTIVRSQTACTIAGTITWAVGNNNTTLGDSGGSGGGGGGGTASGTTGGAISWAIQGSTNVMVAAGTAGASSGGVGGAGSAMNTQQEQMVISMGQIARGATGGGAGGSSGGAAGAGAPGFVLVCPSINFTGVINFNGGDGVSSAANTTGAGGGGGGGVVVLSTPAYAANTGEVTVSGGKGAGCTNPAVIFGLPASPQSGILTGSGAVAHVSTFAAGNPTVVTVDTAGSGYNYTPTATLVGSGGGANTGSGATLVVTMAGVSPNMTVSSIAVSGGNGGYGTGTTYTTCGRGGDGGVGWSMALTAQ